LSERGELRKNVKFTESQLVVPNDTAYLGLIGSYVAYVARLMGFSEGDIARIRLAVDEACTNVIDHAYPPGERAHFSVTCDCQADALRIAVWDGGQPFDLDRVPLPDLEAPLEKRKIGGLGIYLMRKVMDEVHLCEREEGKEVVLIKRLPLSRK